MQTENLNNHRNSYTSMLFMITAGLLGVAVPVSTAFLNIVMLLCLISLLISGNLYKIAIQIKNMLKNPLILLPLVIFGLYFIPSLVMQNHYGLELAGKYRKLLYPIVLVPFFLYNKNQINTFLKSFQITNAIVMLIILGTYIINYIMTGHLSNKTFFFKNYLIQGYLLSISTFIWIIQANSQTNLKTGYIYWLIALLTSITVLFILPGRIGFLVLFVSLFVYLALNLNVKTFLIAGVITCTVFSAMLHTNNRILSRIVAGTEQVQQYIKSEEYSIDKEKDTALDKTSMGFRVAAAHKAIRLIEEAPILGHGPGSYAYKESQNPHNEYLLIAVQFGFIGLFIFLYWLYKLYVIAWKQPSFWRQLFFIVTSAYVVGFVFNSFLRDFTEGTFFMICNSILVTLTMQRENNQNI